MLGDAGHLGVFLDDAFDRTGSEAAEIAGSVDFAFVAAVVEKERNEGVGAGIKIILDMFGGGRGDEDWAILTTFATDDEFAAVEVDGVAVEAGEFGNAEAAGEK